jgi:hypothetical protein
MTMFEPATDKRPRTLPSPASLSSAIAGFALLSGGRLFAFVALVSVRSPVLGAAALVLLALVGWARWRLDHARRQAGARGTGARGGVALATMLGERLPVAGAAPGRQQDRSERCCLRRPSTPGCASR